jgi:curved DNA-binding protein CbpA
MSNTLSDDELFEKMRSKKNNKNNENNENIRDNTEDIKQLEKFGYDYYKILGVDPSTELNDIKRKLRHKIAEYHPDKLKFLSEVKRKTKTEQYQLIRMAGEVLTNPDKRKLYDLERKTLKIKDFANQKNSFEEFLKLQESEINEDSRRMAEIEFKKNIEKTNKMRGFDPSELDVKYDKSASDKLLQDLQAQRDMENIEITQKNLFEGRSFNPSEFNKLFEKNKKKEEKKLRIKQQRGEMVKYDDSFTAFNDTGFGNFISVNDDYGELYGKDDFKSSTEFSRTKTGKSDDELSLSSISDIDYDDDYNNHSKKKITNDDIRKFQQDRNLETTKYNNLGFNEFKSVMDDQFGISKDFGTIIGKDIINKPKQITSHMTDVYNKLIEYSSEED